MHLQEPSTEEKVSHCATNKESIHSCKITSAQSKRLLQSIIYPSEKKKLLEPSAFWHEVNLCVAYRPPFYAWHLIQPLTERNIQNANAYLLHSCQEQKSNELVRRVRLQNSCCFFFSKYGLFCGLIVCVAGAWKYSRLPIIRTFRGNRKKFELSRVKLYGKWSEGNWKLLRVNGRFEL